MQTRANSELSSSAVATAAHIFGKLTCMPGNKAVCCEAGGTKTTLGGGFKLTKKGLSDQAFVPRASGGQVAAVI